MSKLEEEYFKGFTLDRLKALRKAVSKEQKSGFLRGRGYVVKVWIRTGGKRIHILINRRKIDKEIKRRTSENR